MKLRGEEESAKAVWENHRDEEYRRDQSHWLGHGRWKERDDWLRIGNSNRQQIERIFGFLDGDVGTKLKLGGLNILEWGPGGGTNAVAFMDLAKHYYGIDISKKNLDECGRQLSIEGFKNFHKLTVDRGPLSIVEHVKLPIDLIISTACFQHFPTKKYGEEVLEAFRELIAPEGLGYVQIRYDDGTPKYKPKSLAAYKKKHITATSYQLHEFHELLENYGLRPLFMQIINSKTKYARFVFGKN